MFRAKLIFFTVYFFTSQVFAYGLLDENKRNEKLQQAASRNVEEAKKNYEVKFHECFLEGEKNKIGVNQLKKLNLTEDEAKIALMYLSTKNYRLCVGDIADKYSIAVNLARNFDVKDYSLNDDPELGKSNSLADQLAIDEMKYKVDYLEIDKLKREALEKNPILQKVFGIKIN